MDDNYNNKEIFEKNLKTITNKNSVNFIDFSFNHHHKEIVAVDEKGYLLIYN